MISLNVPAHASEKTLAGAPDPLSGDQWALTRCAFDVARQRVQELPRVPVAVIDTGVSDHPDLAAAVTRIFTFGLEAEDTLGHGTSVAGVLGATPDNGIGIAGAANCELYVYKVFGDKFDRTRYHDALHSVAQSDARVINISVTGKTIDPVEQQLISECISAGKIIVAAMGNAPDFGHDAVLYPAAFPGVIAVAATNESDGVPGFSVRGSHVWIAAPGVSIRTTMSNGDYGWVTGTSYATPLVSAACAILSALKPGINAIQTRDLLRALTSTGGSTFDNAAGWGRLDLSRIGSI